MSRFICSYKGIYEPERVEALCEALHVQPLTARALIARALISAMEGKNGVVSDI